MSKTIIKAKCTDQVLTLTNTPVIASGGVGEDYVEIEFCSLWRDYATTVLFWRKGMNPIPVLPDENGFFPVPPELTEREGIVYFGAVGYDNNDNRRTSEGISYRLEAGAITEGAELPAPDGDVFNQLMSYYADVKLYVASRVDDVAKWAGQSEAAAFDAGQAASNAAQQAKAAKESVESIVYPGVVAGYLPEAGSVGITLDRAPSDKMILTFQAPFNDGTMEALLVNAIKVAYPDSDGSEKTEFFMLRDGCQSTPPSEAIGFGDVVTVVLIRDQKNEAFVLNPKITRTTQNKLGSLLHPGQPFGNNDNGTLKVSLERPVSGKMILYFYAYCDSSALTKQKLVVEYETEYGDQVQKSFYLYENGGDRVSEYAFKTDDRVIVFLSDSEQRATILNPRVTKEVSDKIAALETPAATGGGCEVVSYTGDGQSNIFLWFSATPKVVHIDSLTNGGYNVSVTLYRDAQAAKIRVFFEGEYSENVLPAEGEVSWGGKSVTIFPSDLWIDHNLINANGTKYVAMGFM